MDTPPSLVLLHAATLAVHDYCIGHAAPSRFYAAVTRLIPWFAAAALVLAALGLYLGFWVAPRDPHHGGAYRAAFIFVPAAWVSLIILCAIAFWSALSLVVDTALARMMARALAPTGLLFTVVALWSGALWSRPISGEWWVLDGRLAAEAALLALYLALFGLLVSTADSPRARRVLALLTAAGVATVPTIYYAIDLWQGNGATAVLSVRNLPAGTETMVGALVATTAGFWAYSIAVSLARVRCIILEQAETGESLPRAP